jgi:acetoin utilization deacetylase AcuC-like enzyme
MKIVFSKKYTVRRSGHVFRSDKFEAALEILLKEGAIAAADVIEPRPPSRSELLLAHTPAWADKLLNGKLTAGDWAAAEREPGAGLIEAHLFNAGGTILAARLALRTGLGINCGGGGHHAFADHGEGFCLINDIALAVNKLRKEKKIKRALIIDLDAHQGNGTASIFRNDGEVFTFSVHQRGIYPERPEKSALDLELPRGTGDAAYLKLLRSNLPAVFLRARPDLVVYNAGVDVYGKDLLGGFKLTMAGVQLRDAEVFDGCFRRNLPVALALSGGYARIFSDTARLHANTVRSALAGYRIIRKRGRVHGSVRKPVPRDLK